MQRLDAARAGRGTFRMTAETDQATAAPNERYLAIL